jgi:hypothetical protein
MRKSPRSNSRAAHASTRCSVSCATRTPSRHRSPSRVPHRDASAAVPTQRRASSRTCSGRREHASERGIGTAYDPPRRPRWPQMTILVGADPDIPPRRRDREVRDPLEGLGVLDPIAVEVEVLEATAARPPRDARRRAVASPQPRDRRTTLDGDDATTSTVPGAVSSGRPAVAVTGSRTSKRVHGGHEPRGSSRRRCRCFRADGGFASGQRSTLSGISYAEGCPGRPVSAPVVISGISWAATMDSGRYLR